MSKRANPEKFKHDYGVDFNEVEVDTAGVDGQKTIHTVKGKKCRVTELTIRHVGTNDTVITLMTGEETKLSIDVPAETTRSWQSEIGRVFTIGQTIVVRSSDVTGGVTLISGSGVDQ